MAEEQYNICDLAEIDAAAIRVFVLEKVKKGELQLEDWLVVRFESAAETIENCLERIDALEEFLRKTNDAYANLCKCFDNRRIDNKLKTQIAFLDTFVNKVRDAHNELVQRVTEVQQTNG